jgi:hypothetical protein
MSSLDRTEARGAGQPRVSEIERIAPIRAKISGPATRRRECPQDKKRCADESLHGFSIA